MDTTTIVAIAVAAVFLLVLIVWFFSTWTGNLDENAENNGNNIDVLLNLRYDMMHNMVNIVKGYAEHEAGIFDQFAVARQDGGRCPRRGRRWRRRAKACWPA